MDARDTGQEQLAMNYLQLCQRLMVECGISGSLATTSGQSGELLRVTTWISAAWAEIQGKHDDWGFMRASYLNPQGVTGIAGISFPTVAGRPVNTLSQLAINSITKWDQYSFRVYQTAAGVTTETYLDPIDYDDWRDGYMYGALRTVQTRPVAVAISPDLGVCLGPPPDGTYTVEGDFWVDVQQLTADGNIPQGIPTRFHMTIVYEAMKKYAGYEAAQEVMDRAKGEGRPLYTQMEALYAPKINMAAALA